jgi:hypothetical protein
MPFLPYSKIHALVSMITLTKDGMRYAYENPAMLNNLNPFLSKFEWCNLCVHLRNLNHNHQNMVEATGLKVISSRSHSVPSLAYQS